MYSIPAILLHGRQNGNMGDVELVGRGRTADVFAYGDGQVVKVFHANVTAATVEREADVSRAISALKLPAPRFDGAVQVEGRDALVFERVVGPSMLAVLTRAPWRVVPLARLLAEMHCRIHAERAAGLRSQRESFSRRIDMAARLSVSVREAALARLAKLPEGDRVCHGDFHPDNVLLAPHRPVVIDWVDAVQGEPAADVARTLLLLTYASPPSGAPILLVLLLRRVFTAVYWRRYARWTGMRRSEVDAWRLPLVAARLGENLPDDERQRLWRLLS
jgi:aminoglycoside phosphotransferase (APT) family kinase protein